MVALGGRLSLMSEVPLYTPAEFRGWGQGLRGASSLASLSCEELTARFGQPIYSNVQWFRGGLVLEAHRLLYHSAYGLRTF